MNKKIIAQLILWGFLSSLGALYSMNELKIVTEDGYRYQDVYRWVKESKEGLLKNSEELYASFQISTPRTYPLPLPQNIGDYPLQQACAEIKKLKKDFEGTNQIFNYLNKSLLAQERFEGIETISQSLLNVLKLDHTKEYTLQDTQSLYRLIYEARSSLRHNQIRLLDHTSSLVENINKKIEDNKILRNDKSKCNNIVDAINNLRAVYMINDFISSYMQENNLLKKNELEKISNINENFNKFFNELNRLDISPDHQINFIQKIKTRFTENKDVLTREHCKGFNNFNKNICDFKSRCELLKDYETCTDDKIQAEIKMVENAVVFNGNISRYLNSYISQEESKELKSNNSDIKTKITGLCSLDTTHKNEIITAIKEIYDILEKNRDLFNKCHINVVNSLCRHINGINNNNIEENNINNSIDNARAALTIMQNMAQFIRDNQLGCEGVNDEIKKNNTFLSNKVDKLKNAYVYGNSCNTHKSSFEKFYQSKLFQAFGVLSAFSGIVLFMYKNSYMPLYSV